MANTLQLSPDCTAQDLYKYLSFVASRKEHFRFKDSDAVWKTHNALVASLTPALSAEDIKAVLSASLNVTIAAAPIAPEPITKTEPK